MPVGLGLLAGLPFALESLGGRAQKLLDLLQALLLRGELQDLLPDLGLELDAGKIGGYGEMVFKALQTYSDGTVVRWIDGGDTLNDFLGKVLASIRPATFARWKGHSVFLEALARLDAALDDG